MNYMQIDVFFIIVILNNENWSESKIKKKFMNTYNSNYNIVG